MSSSRSLPGWAVTKTGKFGFSPANARRIRYGSGGSGEPITFDVVSGAALVEDSRPGFRLLRRPDKVERGELFPAVKVGGSGLHRCASGELGPFEIDGVIVAAQRELPGFAGRRPASGAKEVLPRNAPFDRPALVLIAPLVQRAAEMDLRLDMEFTVTLEAPIAAGPAARNEHVEDRPGGIDLELVIARLVVGGFEEQLEDVVLPRQAVVFLFDGEEVGILHIGQEVDVLAVPEQLRLGGRAGGAGILAEPGHVKLVDNLRLLPRLGTTFAVDLDRRVGPAALELGGRRNEGGRFVFFRWRGRLVAADGEEDKRGSGEDRNPTACEPTSQRHGNSLPSEPGQCVVKPRNGEPPT